MYGVKGVTMCTFILHKDTRRKCREDIPYDAHHACNVAPIAVKDLLQRIKLPVRESRVQLR